MSIEELEREVTLLKEKIKLLRELEEIESRRTILYVPQWPWYPYGYPSNVPYYVYENPPTTTGGGSSVSHGYTVK